MGTAGSSTVFYFQFAAKVPIHSAVELQPIVCYNRLGYFEPTHNVLPYKLNYLFVFDGCEGFGLYPFAEVVGSN